MSLLSYLHESLDMNSTLAQKQADSILMDAVETRIDTRILQTNSIHAQNEADSTAPDTMDMKSPKAKRRQGVSDLRIPPFSVFALQETSWRLKLWLERESDDSDCDGYDSEEGLEFPHPPRSALEARAFGFRSRDSSEEDASGHPSGSSSPTSSGPPTTPTTSNASPGHAVRYMSVTPLRITKRAAGSAPSSAATSPVALSPPVLRAPAAISQPAPDDDEFYAAYASGFVTLAPRTPPASTAPLSTTSQRRARRESGIIPARGASPTPTGPAPVRLRRVPRIPMRPPPPPPITAIIASASSASASSSISSPPITPPPRKSSLRARSTSPYTALSSSSALQSHMDTQTRPGPGRHIPGPLSSYHHARSTSASSSTAHSYSYSSSPAPSSLVPAHAHPHPPSRARSASDSASSALAFAQHHQQRSPSSAPTRPPKLRPAPMQVVGVGVGIGGGAVVPNFSRPTSLVFRTASPPRRAVPVPAAPLLGVAALVGDGFGDVEVGGGGGVGVEDVLTTADEGEGECADAASDFTCTDRDGDADSTNAGGDELADFAADYAAYAPLLRTPTPGLSPRWLDRVGGENEREVGVRGLLSLPAEGARWW